MDENLIILYFQYLEWEKTGVMPNELGEMCNKYAEGLGVRRNMICILELLKIVAERWIDAATKICSKNGKVINTEKEI